MGLVGKLSDERAYKNNNNEWNMGNNHSHLTHSNETPGSVRAREPVRRASWRNAVVGD